ncbi:DUF4190 domain-containing protein [Agromyces fucosus]|uniref:DUF4190 domain-containing protein n=1 Tax=Agromyces fucosus TaxID=41985 RepID=A0A4Q2JLH8_9MICO|nr:DUF4190 domain-containing protein [Agromyces fucosus]RXZ49005.1 DUF4190 domain-containing protein [Agromyces fucosus]
MQPPATPPAPMRLGHAPSPDPNATNAFAKVSVALLAGTLVLGLNASITAVIFGHLAWAQLRRVPQRGRGLALTGIIGGYVMTAVWFVVGFVLIALVILWPYLLWGLAEG